MTKKRKYLALIAFMRIKQRANKRGLSKLDSLAWADRVTSRYIRMYGRLEWRGS